MKCHDCQAEFNQTTQDKTSCHYWCCKACQRDLTQEALEVTMEHEYPLKCWTEHVSPSAMRDWIRVNWGSDCVGYSQEEIMDNGFLCIKLDNGNWLLC